MQLTVFLTLQCTFFAFVKKDNLLTCLLSESDHFQKLAHRCVEDNNQRHCLDATTLGTQSVVCKFEFSCRICSVSSDTHRCKKEKKKLLSPAFALYWGENSLGRVVLEFLSVKKLTWKVTHCFSYICFVQVDIYPKDRNIHWARYSTWLIKQRNLMWWLSVNSRYNMPAPLVLRAISVTSDPPLEGTKIHNRYAVPL